MDNSENDNFADDNFENKEKLKDVLDEQDRMVTVGRFMDPTEAQFARTALEGGGFEVYMQGANASSLYPGTFSTRLLVKKEDKEAAEEMLQTLAAGAMGPEGDDAE